MIIVEGLKYVSLSVKNIEESYKFYKNLFDLDVIERPENSKEAVLQVGEFNLRLCEAEILDGSERKEDYIFFNVDEEDFEDIIDEIEESKIEIFSMPEDDDKLTRIIIKDPDGNKIALGY